MWMKNIFMVLLGSLFAIAISYVFNAKTDVPVISTNTTLKAFQLGAFKDETSATDLAQKYDAKVISDNGYFYVYYSVLRDEANINKMINCLDHKKIYYYIKDVGASENYKSELTKYEELMKNTTSEIAFSELNKKLISIYSEV